MNILDLFRKSASKQEADLNDNRDIKGSEGLDKRRKPRSLSYEDLMAELRKTKDESGYYHRDMGCGMLRFWNKTYDNKQSFIVNTELKLAYAISAADGTLVGFTKDDIDWDNVSQLEHNGDAYRLRASYAFGVEDYSDGLACVSWMLYPDGRYFADSDGFGMEDNDEVNVYAYIDTECRVIIKFQDLEKARAAYQKMRKARLENKMHSLVEELKRRMYAEVPAYGDFETVEVLKENTDKSLRLTSYGLELMQPPKGIKGRETIRGLKVVGYKGEAGLEILRTTGTVEKILNELEDKTFVDSFAEDVMKINRGASDL